MRVAPMTSRFLDAAAGVPPTYGRFGLCGKAGRLYEGVPQIRERARHPRNL